MYHQHQQHWGGNTIIDKQTYHTSNFFLSSSSVLELGSKTIWFAACWSSTVTGTIASSLPRSVTAQVDVSVKRASAKVSGVGVLGPTH